MPIIRQLEIPRMAVRGLLLSMTTLSIKICSLGVAVDEVTVSHSKGVSRNIWSGIVGILKKSFRS